MELGCNVTNGEVMVLKADVVSVMTGLLERFANVADSMPQPLVGEFNWPKLAAEAREILAGDGLSKTEMATADLTRVAACWNACEGVPTERLDAGILKEATDALGNMMFFTRLKYGNLDKDVWALIQRAEAVFNKLKGEAENEPR